MSGKWKKKKRPPATSRLLTNFSRTEHPVRGVQKTPASAEGGEEKPQKGDGGTLRREKTTDSGEKKEKGRRKGGWIVHP